MRAEIDYDIWVVFINQHNLYDRKGGPAIILPTGSRFWVENGQYHRDDGPAIIYIY